MPRKHSVSSLPILSSSFLHHKIYKMCNFNILCFKNRFMVVSQQCRNRIAWYERFTNTKCIIIILEPPFLICFAWISFCDLYCELLILSLGDCFGLVMVKLGERVIVDLYGEEPMAPLSFWHIIAPLVHPCIWKLLWRNKHGFSSYM
jgi:hypothetical protein